MFTMKFTFENGEPVTYQHIEKVVYSCYGDVSVSGDDIFTHNFPLTSDMHLISANKAYKISHNGLKSIEVEKES